MELNEYQRLAGRTMPAVITEEMFLNAVMGLCGEAGEVCDCLKKEMFQGHPRDVVKLIDELGDVLWYLAEAATALGTSLDNVAEHNIKKLRKRYPDGFQSARSVYRGE